MDDETLRLYVEVLSCLTKEDAARLLDALSEQACGMKQALDGRSDRAYETGYALGFEHGENRVD